MKKTNRLALQRQTIRPLTADKLAAVDGGAGPTRMSCFTCNVQCDNTGAICPPTFVCQP